MSCKKIKKIQAPGHDHSLVDEELEARSNLAVAKTSRKKKRIVEDPTLGADLTDKILRTAVGQLEESNDKPEIVLDFPDHEEDNEIEEEAVEIDLETNDEESRQLFELFKSSVGEISQRMDKQLAKTRHQVDPQVREIYTQLGSVLRLYKSGKLPKAVNTVASQKIPDWMELLELSDPMNWSVNAIQAVTVLFAQTASDGKCTRFYREILLEYVRELLERSRKVPKVVFQTLITAARRAKSFVLGVLIPMSEESQCTMKEARMISTIASRVKLPRDHANAFIIKLCTASDVTKTRTIFLARLIGKGQALAIQAIDAIVAYFLAFMGTEEKQPLLWHRAIFDFVKKYSKDILQEQRDSLAQLLRKHGHPQITPEIFKVFDTVPPREEQWGLGEGVPLL
jgi:essential nuclear protein 1